jgi:hypothetical protein
MLSTDFLKLVFISAGAVVSIVWYVMNKWPQNFACRINIRCWAFVVAGFSALLLPCSQ